MSSPWKIVACPEREAINFSDIMSEDYAQKLHDDELKRYEQKVGRRVKQNPTTASKLPMTDVAAGDVEEWEDYSALLTTDVGATDSDSLGATSIPPCKDTAAVFATPVLTEGTECLSDAEIAKMLQSQFNREYNEELRRIEQKRNKQSKITVTLEKFFRDDILEGASDSESIEVDDDDWQNSDWDRFETNEKILDKIPKCGFILDKEGEMITKHDENLCGVRNACRAMSFPLEFPTGDGAGFDMKLSNQVFNQLKTYSHGKSRKHKMHDRKENMATVEMGLDARTHMLLYKLVNNQILERINGIISTGKEAVILHANSDPNYKQIEETDRRGSHMKTLLPPNLLPSECAIKVYKTTLNDFKQRDRYIKDDYRFKDRFSKQNKDVIINLWAEKEMHNLMRMQSVGINCPDPIVLKKYVLVMSFIGDNNNAAPKLKNAILSDAELSVAYEEIIGAMHKLYNEAKLVHADLSEYNILWYHGKCWFIDVAQSIEPDHPSALEFLMRDCGNIINFFTKRGLTNIYTKEQLFEHITSLNAETYNAAILERIHTRGASLQQATAPNQDGCPDEQKPIEYPFEVAWEKSQVDREHASKIDKAAQALNILSITHPTLTVNTAKTEEVVLN